MAALMCSLVCHHMNTTSRHVFITCTLRHVTCSSHAHYITSRVHHMHTASRHVFITCTLHHVTCSSHAHYITSHIHHMHTTSRHVQMETRRLQDQLEERRRFPLEERLRQNIVGQEGPITTTAAGYSCNIHVARTV